MTIRALKDYGAKSDAKEIGERITKAKAWLVKAPVTNSEDRAGRLLGLKWAGAPGEALQKATTDIRKDQRADGGWAQLPGMPSDAYATGQALYVLHTAGGVPTADPVYQRGVKFLLKNQEVDGTWFVNKRTLPGNNYFGAGFSHGQSQYSSFNGTCWATMALVQTLPKRVASR